MDFFPERTIMADARLAHPPRKINLPALVHAEEFDVAVFNVPKKTTEREDRLDILGELLDRIFEGMDAVLQIVLLFKKTVVPLGRADKFVHEKKIVGAAVGLFFGPEKLQAFFKLRQQGVGFLEGKGPAFFLRHRFVLLAG